MRLPEHTLGKKHNRRLLTTLRVLLIPRLLVILRQSYSIALLGTLCLVLIVIVLSSLVFSYSRSALFP